MVRHPGKGTFVTGVVMRNDLEEPRGWTENAVANGYRPSTVCTDLSMVPGAEVCRLFELKHGEERYCCARRVRALNGKPAVYELAGTNCGWMKRKKMSRNESDGKKGCGAAL